MGTPLSGSAPWCRNAGNGRDSSFDVPVGVQVVARVVRVGTVDRVEVVGEPNLGERKAGLVGPQLVERLADHPRLVLVTQPLGRVAGRIERTAEHPAVVLAERTEDGGQARL